MGKETVNRIARQLLETPLEEKQDEGVGGTDQVDEDEDPVAAMYSVSGVEEAAAEDGQQQNGESANHRQSTILRGCSFDTLTA